MDFSKIVELLAYTIPSLITGGIAYSLFDSHFKDQQNTRRWMLQKEMRSGTLPLRFQAYERMTLFLERINPSQLLVRVAPISEDKKDYQNFIVAQIEQEFEHNLSQQIYISDECWSIIKTAKNATIQMIRLATLNKKVKNASQLQEFIINNLLDKHSPSYAALAFIKNEVSQLW